MKLYGKLDEEAITDISCNLKAFEEYDDVAVGDSVTVTYTGALSEVDPFEGTIVSVEKVK